MKGFTSLLLPLAILLVVAAPNPTAGQVVASPPATPCGNLNFNTSLVSFDTSDLLCTRVWSDQDFMLMYKYNADNTRWSFVLSAPNNNTYIGIGFSNDGQMVGSSAVVGWPAGSNGTGKARQYYLGGFQPAQCEPDKGNLTLANGTPVLFSQSSRFYLAFQLNTTSAGPTDKLIYAVGPPDFVAKSDNLLKYHSNRISTTITYVPGSPSPGSSPTTDTGTNASPPSSRAHGLALGRLSMATISPIAILLAMSLL